MKPYYEHAGITIYHGDCREVLPSLQADVLLTDPPYGVLANGSAAVRRSQGNGDAGNVPWDIPLDLQTIQLLMVAAPTQLIWGGLHLSLAPTFGYLVWDKQIDGLNFGECEVCWTNLRFAPRIFRYRAVGVDGGKQHPTQKPVDLFKWCPSFAPDGLVVDPFLGSGTTVVAAKWLGRKAIGIEQNEAYCEMAAKRLAQEVFDFSEAIPAGVRTDRGGLEQP